MIGGIEMFEIFDLECIIRIVLAAICGLLIGIERKAYYANNTYQHANFYDLCAQERVLKLILDNKK